MNMEKIKNSVGYVRVSTSQQVESGTSVDDQKLKIKEESEKRKCNFVKMYSDEGISGKSTDRPMLKQMLQDAKKGKFEVIIFTKLDRLARNLRDTLNIYHEVEKLGIVLICIENPEINTDGPMGKMLLSIMATFAELERSMIRARTNAGRMIKWKSGESMMGNLPFGYIKNEKTKKIEIDNNKKEIIDNIYNYYLIERLSMIDIAKRLTDEGVSTPSLLNGNKIFTTKWNMNSVREILTNNHYTGEQITLNKNIYTCNKNNNSIKTKEEKSKENWIYMSFPIMIDSNTFNDAQSRIKHNRVIPKNTSTYFSEKLLTLHVLRCGECGAKLTRQATETGKYIYYVCHWRRVSKKRLEAASKQKCNSPYYNHKSIDDSVFNKIIDSISDPNEFSNLFKKTVDQEELNIKIDELKNEKIKIGNEIRKIITIETGTDNEDLIKIYSEKRKNSEELFKNINNKLFFYNNQLSFNNKKNEQIENFKNTFPLEKLGDAIKAKIKIKKMLLNWPVSEKKKLIDAVISPETGGCVHVSRLSEHNLSPDDIIVSSESPLPNGAKENLKISKEDACSDENIVIELDFLLDPHRHSLIIQDIYKKLFKTDALLYGVAEIRSPSF